ncbi:hypothetical protein [Phaeovulum sp.]|uniref:hypothetical protein n=1 Tax=Phaeovulum sp. TaxID=2934796 RepID=UPI0039E25C39
MYSHVKKVANAVIVGSLALIGGCAEYPNRIAPVYIPSIIYNGASCSEINQERERLAGYIRGLAVSQGHAADSDTAAVMLSMVFSPTLLTLPMTVDQSAHLAVARGHYDALVTAGRARHCPMGNYATSSAGKMYSGDLPPM